MALVVLFLPLLVGCADVGAAPSPAQDRSEAPSGFWQHWGDGRAELNGYALTQPRYGELRRGEAVLVFVTETFTDATRVKSNGGHDDEFPVLKLNEVRSFQTGVYDYNVLTSTWLPLEGRLPRGLPTRVSFSMQEWCGPVYSQVMFDPGSTVAWRLSSHSYFDGEADQSRRGTAPVGGVAADALPALVRGLAGDLGAPGERRELPVLVRLSDARMRHTAVDWQAGALTRRAGIESVTVPAGTFEVFHVEVDVGGEVSDYAVETAPPHRLVAWSRSDGERAELTGSIRDAYWQHHGEGDERLRADLGLPMPAWH